jgi:hypothetical protein
MQQVAVANLPPGDIHGLDLQALLKVARQNWSELAFKKNLQKNRKNLLIALEEARNRYAHATVRGVDLDDLARDVQSAYQLLKAISASPDRLAEVQSIHRHLQASLVESFEETSTTSTPTAPTNERQWSLTFRRNPRISVAAPSIAAQSDRAEEKPEEPQSESSPSVTSGGWLIEPRRYSEEISAGHQRQNVRRHRFRYLDDGRQRHHHGPVWPHDAEYARGGSA